MKIDKDLYFKHVKGYKISNAHFELGSNLHIEDYYYAKRLFYNSFYTNRFAFLIADYLLKKIKEQLPAYIIEAKLKQDPFITLLGFENYSELLISNVRKMLNDYVIENFGLNFELFNHDIFTKESLFLKNPGKIGKYIYSIFPISTTFSTSVKIQNEIREFFRENKMTAEVPVFCNPVINCLIISNRKLDRNTDFLKGDIEEEFGWESLDFNNKIITIIDYDSTYHEKTKGADIATKIEQKVEQKYFIDLQTYWHKINTCIACYPLKKAEERCLIETKITPVTPNLIFGFPKNYNYSNSENIFPRFNIKKSNNGPEPLVYRRHFKRYNAHYIYYIRTGRFLQENKTEVKDWLGTMRKKAFKDILDKNIVIITPTFGSNSGFVNLFNDIVFSDTATIIQYSPKEEFIQNFKLFYADVITRAHSVIFVDDVIGTTNTLSEINFFVQNLRKYNEGLNCCVSLINRVGYYNYLKLNRKFHHKPETDSIPNHIVSFVDVNVSPLMHRVKFPYVELTEKFHELAEKSVLDGMKIHFKNKEMDFKPVDLTKEYGKFEKEGRPKALFQFLFLHEFSKIFIVNDQTGVYVNQALIANIFHSSENDSWKLLLKEFEDQKNNNSLNSFLQTYPEFEPEVKNALFKLCTSDPYLQFRIIKKAVFNWVLTELIALVSYINSENEINQTFFDAVENCRPAKYCGYQYFRFLLKRAAKLKMNYIYSLDVLSAIERVLQGIAIYKNITYFEINEGGLLPLDNNLPEIKRTNFQAIYPIEFITYYVGLLQELIIDHESKALQVVVTIKWIIQRNIDNINNGRTLKNSYNDNFLHLLRLLVLENTFIFHTSSEKFLQKMNPKVEFGNNDYGDFNDKLKYFKSTYTFSYTKKMLSRFEFKDRKIIYKDQEDSYDSFKNMLLLKALLRSDRDQHSNAQTISIKDKIDDILNISCDILNIHNGGAYMAVKYKNRERKLASEEDIAIVGEYSRNINNTLFVNEFDSDSLLFKVFNGITEYNSEKPSSVYEVTLDQNNYYHFRHNIQMQPKDISELAEFQRPRFRKLFFLRITEIEYIKEQLSHEAYPVAVLCFYEDEVKEEENKVVDERMQQFKSADNKADAQAMVIAPSSINYDRFDPKKVRQLLLLRNDLGDFIHTHLSNDSLRSYIEMINNENYHVTLNHGTTVYEKLVLQNIDKISKASTLDQAKDLSNYLQVTFFYLINKYHLMSIASTMYDEDDTELDYFIKPHTIAQFVNEIKKDAKYLLTLHQDNLGWLKEEIFLSFDYSSITEQQLNTQFFLFKGVFKEMIFEILYNIKKHAINENASKINATNKLEIDVFLQEDKEGHWLVISNNFSKKDPDLLEKVNKQISKRQNTHGLNLLYNILYKLTNRKIYLNSKDGIFFIIIPLKLTRNE